MEFFYEFIVVQNGPIYGYKLVAEKYIWIGGWKIPLNWLFWLWIGLEFETISSFKYDGSISFAYSMSNSYVSGFIFFYGYFDCE